MDEKRSIGLTREAYIEFHLSGDPAKVAGAEYDLHEATKRCIMNRIDNLCTSCNSPAYVKKIHPKVPLSWPGAFGLLALVVLGIDSGLLHGRLIKLLLDLL